MNGSSGLLYLNALDRDNFRENRTYIIYRMREVGQMKKRGRSCGLFYLTARKF